MTNRDGASILSEVEKTQVTDETTDYEQSQVLASSPLAVDKTQVDDEMRTAEEDDEVSISEQLQKIDYYHGMIMKSDADGLLREEGDFLVRKSEHNSGVIVLCLSVKGETGRVWNFLINTNAANSFFVNSAHKSETIPELINWYRSTCTPLTAASNAKLKRGIERPSWALDHDAIFSSEKLSRGAFREVHRATYVSENGCEEVAVKTLKGEASRDARVKFMKEARMMRKYDHPNVVKILGLSVLKLPLLIVMEYCKGGTMSWYLMENGKTMPMKEKNRLVAEAAEGLAYLEKQKCIHRRIAAKNYLLSGDNKVVKLSHFGLSDDKVTLHDDFIQQEEFTKWLAPESLQDDIYSLKSDVFAFGVLVWEIYSNGAELYPGLTNLEARMHILDKGLRMEMPEGTPHEMAKIALSCWDKVPEMRPTISAILPDLKKIADK